MAKTAKMAKSGKTYAQLKDEIDALTRHAEQVRQAEVDGTIERIKVAIAHYGLTVDDLFGRAPAKGVRKPARGAAKPAGAAKAVGRIKYQDGNGNGWSGMGPRPGWVKAAIAAGQTLESLLAPAAADGGEAAAPAPKRGKKVAGTKLPAKYRDDAGNAWTGRGSTPRWVKAALEAGKTLDQLAVQ